MSGVEQAIPDQPRQRDEQLIPGEGRGRRVGRVSQTGWAKRQYLPERLSTASKPIDVAKCGLTEVTDPMWAGKRGWVTNYATLPIADSLH